MSGSNGALSSNLLATVQGDMQLRTQAAVAYTAMERAARRDKTRISIPGPYGAYRSLADQRWMRAHAALYPGKKLAAVGASSHGTGLAVDIVGDLRWAIVNAPLFGFSLPIPGDVNHFEHDGKTTTATGQTRKTAMTAMYVKGTSKAVYAAFTDANGRLRLRTCQPAEAAFATSGGYVSVGNDETLTMLGVEAGWPVGGPEPALPLPHVAGQLNLEPGALGKAFSAIKGTIEFHS